ncbi:MAG: redoxin domain-containing protein [Sphingomonadaceae bacterium]
MRPILPALAALAVLAPAALPAVPALAAATVGQAAPAFTGTDSKGRSVSLAALRGRTVVLEWTNAECPFVVKHYGSGNMQRLQAAAARDGVVWLTINSGAPGKQGHVSGPQADAIMAREKAAPAHYLLDPAGTIGRAYGATTTPHMFVIDARGTMVYAGGIDDRPTANAADIPGARNFVALALADLAAGRPVATPTARPYGCSVKY